MKRLLAAALLTGALFPSTAGAACRLDTTAKLGDRLRSSDGAFVGRRVKRDGSVLVFRVELAIKGRIGRRVRVRGLSGCGSSVKRGRRVGVLLDRSGGRWRARGPSVVSPGALLNAAGIGP